MALHLTLYWLLLCWENVLRGRACKMQSTLLPVPSTLLGIFYHNFSRSSPGQHPYCWIGYACDTGGSCWLSSTGGREKEATLDWGKETACLSEVPQDWLLPIAISQVLQIFCSTQKTNCYPKYLLRISCKLLFPKYRESS